MDKGIDMVAYLWNRHIPYNNKNTDSNLCTKTDWRRFRILLNDTLASRRLYNILYFLWLYNEFFIILYNILKITELDCCQIIILSIYVLSIHAYTHVLCLSLDLPYETR